MAEAAKKLEIVCPSTTALLLGIEQVMKAITSLIKGHGLCLSIIFPIHTTSNGHPLPYTVIESAPGESQTAKSPEPL